MRAFCRIGFSAKSAWVSAAFLLPIVLLAWALWSAASINVNFAAQERLGVEYVRTLMPLLDAAQNRRHAAAGAGADLDMVQQLEEISRGNLTLNPRPCGQDEVAKLMNTLADSLESLRRVVGQIRSGAGEIQTASSEVASASMDLSRRTEETAAQVQRTSAAMTPIGTTVHHTA